MLIVGVGNQERRDDGVGLQVIRALAGGDLPGSDLPGVELAEHSGEATSLMALWEGRPTVVVDAMQSGQPAGTIRRINALTEELPEDLLASCSTHAFGLAQAVELARALGTLPPRLVVYAVEGVDFSHGEGLSDDVAAVVDDLCERLLEEQTHRGEDHPGGDHPGGDQCMK